MKRIVLIGVLALVLVSHLRAGEIGFVEDFTLATDREAALKQLIPGTEEFYYWHCVHLLNTEQYAQVEQLLVPWVQRHGETQLVWEVRTRRALLSYDQNPEQSLQYLRNRFGIHYPHQQEQLNAEPALPVALEPAQIARQAYSARALAIHQQNLHGFEDVSFEWLIAQELNVPQRRQLLSRLTRPDYPRLPKLIADDLNADESGGFGSHAIHSQLLLPQLEELLKLKPELLNQQQFVLSVLRKLQPGPDVDWQHDPAELAAYLDRLQSFSARLAPVHNSLKAHVQYHRLLLDRTQGTYNKERLLAYLKLPRSTGYMSKAVRESDELRSFGCDLNSNYDGTTLLPPVGNDEPLIRSYLAHFFVEAGNYKEYEPYVSDIYLKSLFAETKIVNGLGNAEQWASLLSPEQFRSLKERVDLDFDFANQTQFKATAPVSLDLHVKNASTLIVKVFEINTQSFYRTNGREVSTDINLDGLIANHEQTYQYNDPPLRRVKRKFDFPMLSNAGVYVIDFIGNGQSSRALIRKGQLRQLVRTTPVGQSFTILDEENKPVPQSTLWLAGHEYTSNEQGLIHVPFSSSPGRQAIVISAPTGAAGATYSALSYFNHEPENYQFVVGIHVDRESLLTRRKAQVILRPQLLVNGTPVTLKRLEELKLTISSTDHDGIASSTEIPGIQLFDDRETIHEFQVPQRLSAITFHVSGKVKQLITGTQQEVGALQTFTLNGIAKTERIEDLHLLRSGGNYILELRGLTGEPKASRPVHFEFKHRDFKESMPVLLKSDPRGRVTLGPLADIMHFSAVGPEGTSHSWVLPVDRHTYAQTLHGRVGEAIVLPYLGAAAAATRAELSLLELRGGTFSVDRFEHLALQNGLLNITQLPAGDYSLLFKTTGTHITLRVVAGAQLGQFVVGPLRQLETLPLKSLQIESIIPNAENVTIKLQNVSQFTRVHVFATRLMPEYDAFADLGRVRSAEPYLFSYRAAESVYLTGRNIGDEYRYIIDRKYATKFPGNMLERPSLLLNPWAIRDTETGEQIAAAGGAFGAAGDAPASAADRMLAEPQAAHSGDSNFANLDFLASAAEVLTNLVADANGVVTIPLAALGAHQELHVVAVDPLNTTIRSISLPEQKTTFVDLRLANGLDPQQHFTRQKEIDIVPVGQALTLHDLTTAKFEVYDSLPRVYGLYATLNNDPKLIEFSFLLNWPKLKIEEKRTLYSRYASHELSFFLFKKDPEFFQAVIKPYLVNKKDKTFLDHFLLEDDLSEYLLPWKYGQLNIVERILLARRIDGEHARTARHVGDLQALLPRDLNRFNYLFDSAVQRSALETTGTMATVNETLSLMIRQSQSLRDESVVSQFNAPAPMSGARGMGGGGSALGGIVVDETIREKLMEEMDAVEAKKDAATEGLERRRSGGSDKREQNADRKAAGAADMDFALADDFYAHDALGDLQVRQLYRRLDKTKEWAENNYHQLTIDQQQAGLITVNSFWKDYAAHDPATPFLSTQLAEASRNFPEMLLALAVLDLPFEAPEHKSDLAGVQLTFTPGGPAVVYHEEIQPAAAPDGSTKVLVSQNFFRHGDRMRVENGETVDKFVSEEFLIHTVYGCQVVITNPTATRQKLNVLVQIPRGALPVLNSQVTKTEHLDLEPYNTKTLEYHFYFPAAATFPHFPVHVAKNEQVIAAAEPFTFVVVEKPTKIDTESWDYISQFGELAQVVQYLETHNINDLNLDKIAWRMHDQAAFEAILPLLAGRHVYSHTLWSYALLHNAVVAANEYLQHADGIVNECGGRLKSTLLTIDPVQRRTYQHLEYKPLVNARTHALGQRRQIVNDVLHGQYHQFLNEIAYERQLNDTELLGVTYYLLLQDRIEAALATFARVNRANVTTQMQYDYCDAYLKFFSAEPEQARAIAEKYQAHPVDRWRNTFATIVAQLDEATGKNAAAIDAENRDQQQGALAATEPSFDFTVEAKQIKLNSQNLAAVTINFYQMDVELLFSRNPFVQEFGGEFASIKPNHSLSVALPKDQPQQVINLPEALLNSNVLVEVVGAGQTRTQPYFANSLFVQVIENYGQVQVTHRETRQPVSRAYVKVYAQTVGGEVKFYKDGYTDLRGRFDYASLNTNDLDVAQKFSILVLSDEHGAVVREASPPQQ